jgi:hypothetical protein
MLEDFMPSLSGLKQHRSLKDELDELSKNINISSQNILNAENEQKPEEIIRPKQELPPVLRMAKNLTQATQTWVNHGFATTKEETLKSRIEACKKCEFWNSKGFSGTGRCMKCGCSTWAKLRMAKEKCPIGKW